MTAGVLIGAALMEIYGAIGVAGGNFAGKAWKGGLRT